MALGITVLMVMMSWGMMMKRMMMVMMRRMMMMMMMRRRRMMMVVVVTEGIFEQKFPPVSPGLDQDDAERIQTAVRLPWSAHL